LLPHPRSCRMPPMVEPLLPAILLPQLGLGRFASEARAG
jgi:hypothetical protein